MKKIQKTSAIKTNDERVMKLMAIRKPYIDTVNYHEEYLNGQRCIVLDVYYQHSHAAHYHAGRNYLTEFMNDTGIYMGTPNPQILRQYWYQCTTSESQGLDMHSEYLQGVYHEEVNVHLPMPIRDPEAYREQCEARKRLKARLS
jgi:hypothetical protein